MTRRNSDPATTANACPARPRLALRVGVTGARDILAAEVPRLQRQVAEVLGLLRSEMQRLTEQPEVQAAYAGGAGSPRLRLLSPLARGADRLVAAAALDLGFSLEVALPFPQAEYEKDFKGTSESGLVQLTAAEDLSEFHTLLDRSTAPAFAHDGARGDAADASYEAVGRYVARNSDILIAIWDGHPGKGLGGTSDIVRFAPRIGTVVWWIHANKAVPPILATDTRDLRQPNLAPCGAAAEMSLRKAVADMIQPPQLLVAHPHSWIGGRVEAFRRWRRKGQPPLSLLDIFVKEAPLPDRFIWQLHKRFMIFAAGKNTSPTKTSEQSSSSDAIDVSRDQEDIWSYWGRLYAPPDGRANDYAPRYRSSYVMIFVFATVALVCAMVAIAFHTIAYSLTFIELLALLLIISLVAFNQWYSWHHRWIAYRLLAELCRKQQALAILGWSLPSAEVRRASSGDADRRNSWVAWYFNAAMRTAPLPTSALNAQSIQIARDAISKSLVVGQKEYQHNRKIITASAGHWFIKWGERLFLLTLVVVSIKFAFLTVVQTGFFKEEPPQLVMKSLGLAAALAAAFSAALIGIRSYAELELIAEQSAQMEDLMRRAELRLAVLQPNLPLASQELGAEVLELAAGMLQEVGAWAQLFGVKAVEAG